MKYRSPYESATQPCQRAQLAAKQVQWIKACRAANKESDVLPEAAARLVLKVACTSATYSIRAGADYNACEAPRDQNVSRRGVVVRLDLRQPSGLGHCGSSVLESHHSRYDSCRGTVGQVQPEGVPGEDAGREKGGAQAVAITFGRWSY